MQGIAPAGEVWHFSDDPSITRFVPHVAATATLPEAYVWACPPERCPDYWFPRQCPRMLAWRTPGCDDAEADRLLGVGVGRRHVIEPDWADRLPAAVVYAYPFAARDFAPIGDPPHAVVATREVVALRAPERLTELPGLHARAGIALDVREDPFAWWEDVIGSGLGFSGIRLKNSPRYRDVTRQRTGWDATG